MEIVFNVTLVFDIIVALCAIVGLWRYRDDH